MAGIVTFVGAGCGDPRLLTLRAAEVLGAADVVLFDLEVHPEILGRAREGALREPVVRGTAAEPIAARLADEAAQGKRVVRLCWGDPVLLGGAEQEASLVARRGVAIEIVPGVDALAALGAFSGTCLTSGGGHAAPSVAVVSVGRGQVSSVDWKKLATAADTLAVVVEPGSLEATSRQLARAGRDPATAVTIVDGVSLPTQRVTETTLAGLAGLAGITNLDDRSSRARVVLVVGAGARRRPELGWFEKLPLFGKRVLVTRAREQAGGAAALLRERGADPVLMPTIEIHPPSDPAPVIEAVDRLAERYGWVVFTSANGVDRLWAEVRRQAKDARAFGRARIAAIGPGTAAALERIGLSADLVAKEHKGEALAEELLAAMDAAGAGAGARPRVLVARAEVARDVLPDTLRAAGCDVDVVAVYKTRSPPRAFVEALGTLFEAGEIDAVMFTSSSTVEHLCDALEARASSLLAKTCVASIGPVTTETARRRGLRVDVVAREYTIPGLVAALERHFGQGR